ncbi:MAG: YhjD/YihY/BrkB family envelope integrity protein [Nitrospiraceae bacterium]
MSRTDRVEQFFRHDLWVTDLSSLTKLQRFGIQALRLAFAVASEFRHRLLDARAAGLVYTTLLSLVPFLAVMFSVLKAFGVHEQIEPVLAQALEPLGPKGQEITAQIIGFVNNMKVGVLGVVGVAGLFYTTYSLIDKIEGSLNAIWRARQGRPLVRKFTDYLSVVLVGPLLVMTAFGLLASVQSHALVQRVMDIQPFGYVVVWAAQFVPFVLLCTVFTFLYKFVPYTYVRLRSALVGGITAAVLWGLAGEAFAAFVAGSAKYSAIYSSFAILILFLLWLYVGWLIILVGAQVSFFHQYPSAYQTHLLWKQGAHAFRERLALILLMHIARRYLKGERPYRVSELASDLNIPLSIVEDQVDELVAAGFLCRIAEPDGIGLVKPPELIPIKEILDTVRDKELAGPSFTTASSDTIDRLLGRRDHAVGLALSGITLRSLAAEPDAITADSETPARILKEHRP